MATGELKSPLRSTVRLGVEIDGLRACQEHGQRQSQLICNFDGTRKQPCSITERWAQVTSPWSLRWT